MTTGGRGKRIRKGLGGLLAALVLAGPASLTAAPQRVVSINACTDQLVMLLAPAERIRSLSYLAADPAVSVNPQEARRHALNHGRAEEIIPLDPDLVVAGRFSAPDTVRLLASLGYPVLTLEPAATLADIPRNLRELGAALGEGRKAEALARRFEERLAALRADMAPAAPVVADYAANGMTSGAGTLLADIVRHAGLRLWGDGLGIAGVGAVSLEQLIARPPDLLLLATPRQRAPALASANFRHPAFRDLAKTLPTVTVPPPYLACGTPATLTALEILQAARPETAW